MTSFVQFAHGLLLDVQNFGRQHSVPLPSFNPHPDDLPGAEDASPTPLTVNAAVYMDQPRDAATGQPLSYTPPAEGEEVSYTPPEPVDHNIKIEAFKSPEELAADEASSQDVRAVADIPNAPLDANDHTHDAADAQAAADAENAGKKKAD